MPPADQLGIGNCLRGIAGQRDDAVIHDEARGIDTLIISGTLTNCCCESTARDAFFAEFWWFAGIEHAWPAATPTHIAIAACFRAAAMLWIIGECVLRDPPAWLVRRG